MVCSVSCVASPLVRLSQPRFERQQHQLRPIRDLHLQEHVRDVVAHRLRTELELLRYLAIRVPTGDQIENLVLTLRQLIEGLLRNRRLRSRQILDDSLRNSCTKNDAAMCHSVDGAQQLGLVGIFQQIAPPIVCTARLGSDPG
jgi:hypothetical protein